MKNLKNLEEHNKEVLAKYPSDEPMGNGFECPACGSELYDISAKREIGFRVQYFMGCPGACSWTGDRY